MNVLVVVGHSDGEPIYAMGHDGNCPCCPKCGDTITLYELGDIDGNGKNIEMCGWCDILLVKQSLPATSASDMV